MATHNDLPLVQFTFDPDEASDGIKAVALVDVPAIESAAIHFDKDKKVAKFVKVDDKEYEGKVAGLLLRHSFPILRADKDENFYYGEFSKEVVKGLQEKFHKELQSNNVNADHSDNKIDAYLVSDYIIESEEMLKHVNTVLGHEDAQIGDWFGIYKIDDVETFERVVEGELTGFSIEAFLEVEFNKIIKNNNDLNKLFKMDNKDSRNLLNKFFDFMKNQIDTFEEETVETTETETTLESVLVPEEAFTANFTEVGAEVTKTYTNEAEEEVTEAIGEGTFVLEDGRSIIVDADSNLTEIVEAVVEAEVVEEKLAETEVVEAEVETDDAVKTDMKTLLDSILGEHENGEFYVSVYKQDGEYKWGSVSMYKDLQFTKEVEKTELELKTKITELETKLSDEPASDPVLGNEVVVDVKDTTKMTAYERLAAVNGWENAPVLKRTVQ